MQRRGRAVRHGSDSGGGGRTSEPSFIVASTSVGNACPRLVVPHSRSGTPISTSPAAEQYDTTSTGEYRQQ
eukprot:3381064-Rhodomonas_salina.1